MAEKVAYTDGRFDKIFQIDCNCCVPIVTKQKQRVVAAQSKIIHFVGDLVCLDPIQCPVDGGCPPMKVTWVGIDSAGKLGIETMWKSNTGKDSAGIFSPDRLIKYHSDTHS